MSASPAQFLFGFLIVSILLWLLFIFASRLLAWTLSRVVGASVGFRVGGWKCLRDVVVKFKKGAVESVSVGEIRLSLRQSLVKLGVGFISRDPKLQVLICDLEVVMRPSNNKAQKTKCRKSRTAGRGKWMVVANMARFLSVSVTELVVRTPKATIELKELCMDISKNGGSNSALFVRLQIMPIVAHLGELWVNCDQGLNQCAGQAPFAMTERIPASFSCEEFFLLCEFGHDREAGVVVKNVDVSSGEVSMNLAEELLLKKKSPSDTFSHAYEVIEPVSTKQTEKKQGLAVITQYISLIPEKLVFNLPKLDVKFVHRGHNLLVENNIMGIQLKSVKSRAIEDVGESTRLDVQMDFSEIHLMREAGHSIVEILKLDVISFVYIPLQPTSPIRSEIDVKLGGTQCNMIMSRLKPWMHLHSSKKKKIILGEERPNIEKVKSAGPKAIMWTCTISAPEMTIVLYNLSGVPIYHGCSQSSHVFANNISNTGTAVHMELGELNLHMEDEYQESLQESLFGVETNMGSLLHIAKVSLDWAQKNMDSPGEDGLKSKFVLSVDVTGMGVYLTFKRVESLVSTTISFSGLLKIPSTSGKKPAHSRREKSSRPSGKGIQLLKFNLGRCSLSFHGDVGLENTVVADPKRVNYGSQGGRILVTVSADGTPRTANVMSALSDEYKKLNYSVSLDIFHFNLCMNKEKQSTQLEVERARTIYQEFSEDNSTGTKVTLFDLQNAKFVQRAGGLKEIAVCSLFSATDIAVMWEPDVHIALFELVLQLQLLVHNQKLQGFEDECKEDIPSKIGNDQRNETLADTLQHENHHHKKRESIFAVDVEMLSISAEVGDGVQAFVQIQSLFSENARIGVLLEGLLLNFNDTRVFKSSRMQISRIPNASSGISDAKTGTAGALDWVIQALDVHICMPYRLQLRAIDDSIEDMLRALKLITAAKRQHIFSKKKDTAKLRRSSSLKVGCIKFCIRKLTADIEEEPIQGWLDEHYQLLKNEACELAVRLNFLDEFISRGSQCPGTETKDSAYEGKIHFGSEEIDLKDTLAINKFREVIYKQSFRSYYHACRNLVPSEGSGACKEGFQAGFKTSVARTSLFSISATELDVSLTKIEHGDAGMIETLQRLDPVCQEYNIPFSRLYGSNICLCTASLVVQLRNYTFPLFSATSGRCDGRIVLAQQATCFQPQVYQNVFIGRWWKVRMLRSASGTTPPIKTYSDLPIHFQKAEISYGVGFEPAFADISYAFTVALRRANLSIRDPNPSVQLPKKERSLPWWDEMRNYIHGKISLYFSESRWNILATTDPYEKCDKLQIVSGHMEVHQSDGRVYVSAKDFKILVSSLEALLKNCTLKLPARMSNAFLEAPVFSVEVTMQWDCDSGNSLNHYLYALPRERLPREKVFDPFRSTSLSLRWDLSFRPALPDCGNQSELSSTGDHATLDGASYCSSKSENAMNDSPTVNVGPHDLAWLIKFWNMNYIPPHKLRTFSRWPRFGIPRIPRSGNLSLDKVMTEFMFRVDATPTCIRHMSLDDDDPARGLTFDMRRLKYELCYSRGKQKYTFECKREPLDLVYQGLDLHVPKAHINKEDCATVAKVVQITRKSLQCASMDIVRNDKSTCMRSSREKHRDDGFLLSSDYFTIRRHSPKADPARLLAWQEAGRKNSEMTYVRSEFENGSESDEHTRSDHSDDDGYNVVEADNCQSIFVYGLKLLWTLENRDAVWSWVGGLSKAFESPKPSPSRQYAQRKLHEDHHAFDESEMLQEDMSKYLSTCPGASCSSPQHMETSRSGSSPSHSVKADNPSACATVRNGNLDDAEEEGTRHFMVNVIEPQFNLHSEEANGRFLLAAVRGRVLVRSFHSVLHVGYEMIEQALGGGNVHIPESQPEMTWNRMEFSVMLEHVQAHVAPTDVDPGAGLQWLPKIRRSSPKVTRTGALLERVFMPCDMYFRYTRHKGGTADLKVKPLKELTFNSHNISATMTSRQFQVMLDVLTNLLFARLPKPRKSSLSFPAEDDGDVEEEADEVVPDGVEEVELARVNLERKERVQKLLLDDIRKLSLCGNTTGSGDLYSEKEGHWIITGGRSELVHKLKKELVNAQKSRKAASASLRMALQKAAQLRLMEKEKNKSPSYAMRISLKIYKVVWEMLVDGKSFAEAEINDMIYDFDRDYKDVGIARFTTKYFVVRNCFPNAKCDMLLSAWNPPPEWGKKVMLRVDAKQGAPKDGNCPLELFQVEIYPLKIHLTEAMYRMMWEYFFPEEEQDSQRRQEVWKVSTTAGARRVKKGSLMHEPSQSNSHSTKEFEVPRSTTQSSAHADSSQASKLQNLKANIVCGSTPELRRTSSFDRTWEENVAESVANELVLQVHSSSVSSSKSGPLGGIEQQDEPTRIKSKDLKQIKSGRSSHEEKKVGKAHDEKRSRPRKLREFHNIKISQVELLVTYEGSRFAVSDLRLLMDTFHRVEFTGTWRRLFSRVKKHIIWGVLKSVTGMQGKKFKDKAHSQTEASGATVPDSDLNFSDSDGGSTGKSNQYPLSWPKRPSDGAGDGFVTSIRGLFNSQRRKAKAFVLRTMRGDADNELHGDWSESDVEFSPFARPHTITKAKRLIKLYAKKSRSRQKGLNSQQRDSFPSSPRESTPFESDPSSGSSPYEDFHQ